MVCVDGVGGGVGEAGLRVKGRLLSSVPAHPKVGFGLFCFN